MSTESKIVYSPGYDLLPNGFGLIHPFDVHKYSRAWGELKHRFSSELKDYWLQPEQPVTDDVLLEVHSSQYLDSLANPDVVARIIEVHVARYLPRILLNRYILKPMKYACEGTRLATQYALDNAAMVMNLGAGYHHAFADHGEGFCVFADAAVAIADARKRGALGVNDKVLMIDLDAHRGNGFNEITDKDEAIDIFDMYNFQAYPGMHAGDMDDYPFMIPLKSRMNDETYLQILKAELPRFIESAGDARLVFYNAGTDILEGDRIGNLNVSYAGVVERDRYVISLLKSMNIATVIMTSGGYTKQSYLLVANQAVMVIGE